ncbi:MAG: sigma-70 family RNA polymerase sigma factor, partial [Acidobacteria bacterium]|nr:sigma-70 family RNA polymerase sigma factor [Acidobacteriota bacterium]
MAVTHVAPAVRQERAAVDSQIAEAVCALLLRGDRIAAGERFAEIVERHQRRATRIAYYYLRDPAEVDEAVQDAFLKAFVNIRSFRERLYFELWFTRILVNGCLDRVKSRARRNRWIVSAGEYDAGRECRADLDRRAALEPSAEAPLLQ